MLKRRGHEPRIRWLQVTLHGNSWQEQGAHENQHTANEWETLGNCRFVDIYEETVEKEQVLEKISELASPNFQHVKLRRG